MLAINSSGELAIILFEFQLLKYSRDDIKNWISFGINNDYVNKFKKDEIAKWTDLMLKHGVIKMEGINRKL